LRNYPLWDNALSLIVVREEITVSDAHVSVERCDGILFEYVADHAVSFAREESSFRSTGYNSTGILGVS
jgi:hypothetical protein